jgi:hypothetical protein
MNEHVVPSALAQSLIIKFVTNENVKPAEILMIFRAQFGEGMLSRIQAYYWTKSFNVGDTEVENMLRREGYGQRLFGTLTAS